MAFDGGVGVAAAVAGLVMFVAWLGKLLSFIADIPRRCMELSSDMAHLKNVLKVLRQEYDTAVAFIKHDATLGTLKVSLDNTMRKCQEIESIAEKINRSFSRRLAGVKYKSRIESLQQGLESDKKTIELLVSVLGRRVQEEREKERSRPEHAEPKKDAEQKKDAEPNKDAKPRRYASDNYPYTSNSDYSEPPPPYPSSSSSSRPSRPSRRTKNRPPPPSTAGRVTGGFLAGGASGLIAVGGFAAVCNPVTGPVAAAVCGAAGAGGALLGWATS